MQTLEFFGVPGSPVDYNVIWLDNDTAIEYDCNEHDLGLPTDYCIHIMSRTPVISQDKLDTLIQFAG